MADPRAWQWSAVLLLTCCMGLAQAGDSLPSYSIYLVRHAEKATGPDPALTEAGIKRAEWLAGWISQKNITAVWSSDYRRTRETAAPAARALGLTVHIYNPRQLEDLANVLLSQAETALVVGHSNTTPELAALLCKCTVTEMAESEYDRITVVRIDSRSRNLRELDSVEIRRSGPDR